jgi:hypothetical protein
VLFKLLSQVSNPLRFQTSFPQRANLQPVYFQQFAHVRLFFTLVIGSSNKFSNWDV